MTQNTSEAGAPPSGTHEREQHKKANMRKRRDAGRRTLAHTVAQAGTPCTAGAHDWPTHWHAHWHARWHARWHAHVLPQRSAHSRAYLSLCRSAVTRNYSEKGINKVLDLVSGSQNMEVAASLTFFGMWSP